MRLPACLCVLALVAFVSCTGENEFGASIPVGFFGGFFNRLVFPLLGDWSKSFGNNFPSECCYKGRGVRIQITDLTEHGLNANSVVSSTDDGISMLAQMGVAWDFHFKLCAPVGKECTPLFSCNDDVELQFTVTTQSTLEASATGEGKLNLTSSDSTLKLDISYGDLCDTVKGILAGVVSEVNNEFSIIYPKLVNALLGAIGDALSLSLQFGNANVQVLYSDSETGTTDGGLVVGGSIPVTNVNTGKQGNFTPSSPLPDLLTTPQPATEEELYIADSIPNNILQVLFEGTIPDHFTLDVYLQGNLFKLHAKLRESPQVSFSPEGNSVLIKTREVVQNGLLRIDFDVNTQIFFGFGHDQNKIFLTLSPDNFVFDVEFLPPADPLKNITELVDQIVEAQWNKYIPILDEFLADHPIPLPPLPFFQFPGMENFDGYTRIFVENNAKTSEEVSFSSLAAGYPRTAAMLNGMVQGVSGPSRKFFQLFGEKLAQTLDDLSLETPREGRTAPNGKKGFYCPLIIPGFSLDECPDQ